MTLSLTWDRVSAGKGISLVAVRKSGMKRTLRVATSSVDLSPRHTVTWREGERTAWLMIRLGFVGHGWPGTCRSWRGRGMRGKGNEKE